MKKAVHEGLLFSCCQKAAQKHGWYPCQSVLRASQNQASTLDCRKETPCSNPELVVRECGLMLYVDVNPCFRHWYCFRNFQAPGGIAGRAPELP